jgi:hypothetical protein
MWMNDDGVVGVYSEWVYSGSTKQSDSVEWFTGLQ